jgi:hypothetical protein
VRIRNWLLGGAAVAGMALAGCSTGPPVHSTIGKGTTFCNDLSAFATQVDALNNAADEPLSLLASQIDAVHQSLVKLVDEAPAADTVGGHTVKSDLTTEASAFAQLSSKLASANPSDPNAVGNALAAVNAQLGGPLTDATNRLDQYAKKVCGVTVASPNPTTTTTPAASTTSTGPGPSTTPAPAVGPTTPASTTAP